MTQPYHKRHPKTRYTRHGMSGTRIYLVWNSMISRCNDPSAKQYRNYGARGIRVCDEWYDFKVWWEYVRELPDYPYDDAGARVGPTTLDRINNGGDYRPGNVRWATNEVQYRDHHWRRPATPSAIEANINVA